MIKQDKIRYFMDDLLRKYPILNQIEKNIITAYEELVHCYENGGKLLIGGNGGSSADADHIVGELMKSFLLPRKLDKELIAHLIGVDNLKGEKLAQSLQKGLPAIALHNHNALNTAFSNDVDGILSYAQQVIGYGNKNDIFMGISTSGNAENLLYASVAAKAKGMRIIGFTGSTGGQIKKYADILINVPEIEAYKVQELQLPIYHCWCLMLEERFFGGENNV